MQPLLCCGPDADAAPRGLPAPRLGARAGRNTGPGLAWPGLALLVSGCHRQHHTKLCSRSGVLRLRCRHSLRHVTLRHAGMTLRRDVV